MTKLDFSSLTAEASINRVIIGEAGDRSTVGRLAETVCSRDALHRLATERGIAGLRPERLSSDLAAALNSSDSDVCRAARAALTTFGERLGALVATLRDPRTSASQGDSPLRQAYLTHWLTVDSIWLAGGLLAGDCGVVVLSAVREVAAEAARPCGVQLVSRPALAPLLGAARYGPIGDAVRAMIVADLGHTSVKTAIVERTPVAVSRLRLLEPFAAPKTREPDVVEGTVVEALATAASQVEERGNAPLSVMVSVASTVLSGIPVDDGQGGYGCLARRMTSLHRKVAAHTGRDAVIRFIHDGTAAAATAGSSNSATITAGTWLGVGFQREPSRQLLNLGPDLQVCRFARRAVT